MKVTAPTPPAKGSVIWMQGLACGALLTFATPTALMLCTLFAPAIACAIGEKGSAQSSARAVALCCAAASLSPLWYLWMQNDRMDVAMNTLSTPLVLITAWGAGASGWALCQVLPIVLRTVSDAQEAARALLIGAELTRTRDEWDLPPDA